MVDAGAHLDARTLAALDAADTILLPVYPEIAALKAVQSLLDFVNETGSISTQDDVRPEQRLRQGDPQDARRRERPRREGRRSTLPYDPFVYHKAANEGNPVVRGAAQSPAALALVQLSATAFGEGPAEVGTASQERRGRGLSGLLKRT